MENSRQSKVIFDILTLVLFLVAFGVAFVYGFVLKQSDGETPRLATDILSIIMVIGFGAVYAMGTGAAFFARLKAKVLTMDFSIISGISTAAFFGVVWTAIMINVLPTGVDTLALKIAFIVCMLALIAAYGESVFVTEPLVKSVQGDEADEESEE
ncbi:MAG: hypothetical protein J6L81_09545 [Clostridia bacterium]|nr:hypothetical protein [Clostridia bacterium]